MASQAASLGLPHILAPVDGPNFEGSYRAAIKDLSSTHGIQYLVTGDILDVASGFMQRAVHGTGVSLVTPLWHAPRWHVLQALHDLGVEAIISCVNLDKFALPPAAASDEAGSSGTEGAALAADPSNVPAVDPESEILGAVLSPELCSSAGALGRAHVAAGVDLCGEGGEYHTTVVDAPLFRQRLALQACKQHQGRLAFLEVQSINSVSKAASSPSTGDVTQT